MLIPTGYAAHLTGLDPQTLRDNPQRYGLTVRWTENGGHRRFDFDECVEVGRRRINSLQERIPKTITKGG